MQRKTLAKVLIFGPTVTLLGSLVAYGSLSSTEYLDTSNSISSAGTILSIVVFLLSTLAIIALVPCLIMGIRILRPDTAGSFVDEFSAREWFNSDELSPGAYEHYLAYLDEISELEPLINAAAINGVNQDEFDYAQKRLDSVATKYGNDDFIGPDRYILFELQAQLHLLNFEDDKAVSFINDAIETRGTIYPRIERLINKLSDAESYQIRDKFDERILSNDEKRKLLIGVEGWLALFTAGLIIGSLANLFILFIYLNTRVELSDINAGGSQILAPSLFEIYYITIVLLMSIVTTILILKRKRLAKYAAIAWLLLNILLGVLYYLWLDSMVSTFDLNDLYSRQASAAAGAARSILDAIIWVTYFIFSKRVAMTLVK